MPVILLQNIIRKITFTAFALLLFFLNPTEAIAANFAVTSPWIGFIASFIAGDTVNVRYLSTWDSNGNVVKTSSPRSGEIIIAIDAKDAENFKIKKNKDLRFLYDELRMTKEQFYSACFDPAMLPFIAQSVMKIMSEEDKARYTYFQRRLAEFQSKIESTIDSGRHLLENTKILDITGAEGTLLRSSLAGAIRPPGTVWEGWKKGDTRALKAALDEAQRRNWLILMDPWTPEVIRLEAVRYEYRLTLAPPSKDQDYFVFLHEIFLAIWNKTKNVKTK
ncbi:MAG: hypothetical protein GXZ00_01020 [Synergistaceae bacterium]|jgi:hypothetical protein|nr:hypothetical protein [Synergistaceae bacterium]